MHIIDQLEQKELVEKLKKWGFGDLIDALIENDDEVYTKKGRLNKCGACRVLGWKSKQLEDKLAACRQILAEEYDD
jgi:hypothetical protein